ncbi:MAG: ABC transporter ATP-binding protein, partial [Bdellovibrionales bacterium]|nr:ABC transporter ATP-binding protein [Bdellovibrionales bacterium]
MGRPLLVHAQQLCKTYRVPVLRQLNLDLHEGESLALVGANGAGKSTFIKIILGLVRADGGSGTLFGLPFGDSRSLLSVGYLPEMPSFWPELDAETFLYKLGGLRGISRSELTTRVPKILGSLGLALRGRRPMGDYSKGMLQRAGIAQALLSDPQLLVLDEPMSGLDPRAQEKLRQILLRLREQGKSLIISSHALEDIRLLCDRVAVLEKGEIVAQGATEKILEDL